MLPHLSRSDRPGFSTTLWLLLLLGIILAIRLLVLYVARTDLFFDEAQYWTWSTKPDFGYYSKPPLIAWLIGLSTSVCGLAEYCIRLPSPLIHTGTALLIYIVGLRLYSAQVGFWSALTFATVPGVSLSSGIISTDVPLLFCWALALVAFVELAQMGGVNRQEGLMQQDRTRSWWPALLLGLAIGLGLNAKYAMAFFVLCSGIYLALTPTRRWLLRDPRLYVALLIGAGMIVPNIMWNLEHSFATFSHTADNANWGGSLLHPLKALEFFGAQFGVFGPVLFGSLIVILWRVWREGAINADRLLLSFTLPVITIITIQALLSRAHANWAATAYVAATVLVVATLIRRLEWRWLKGSMALHIAVALLMGIGLWQAGRIDLPGKSDPFGRTLGWKQLAATTRSIIVRARETGKPYGTIMTDDRSLSAELLYYMRGEPTPLRAWRVRGERPHDHYQLMRPFKGARDGPILLVSRKKSADRITRNFEQVDLVSERAIPAGFGKPRRIRFYRLSGFKPTPPG